MFLLWGILSSFNEFSSLRGIYLLLRGILSSFHGFSPAPRDSLFISWIHPRFAELPLHFAESSPYFAELTSCSAGFFPHFLDSRLLRGIISLLRGITSSLRGILTLLRGIPPSLRGILTSPNSAESAPPATKILARFADKPVPIYFTLRLNIEKAHHNKW